MTVVEVQNADGSWREIRNSGRRPWVVEQGTSDTDTPAPKATVQSDSREDVSAGQNLRVRDGNTMVFEGRITDAPIQGDGNRPVSAEHEGYRLLEEQVTVSVTGTDEDVFQAAVNNSSRSGEFGVSYSGTATSLGDTYEVDNRSIRRVFSDMADRTGRIFWIDGPNDTVRVQPYGGAGSISDVDTSDETYAARLEEFDNSDLKSVTNEATVIGTGGEKVEGFAEDLTSKSDYGRQPERVQVSYITSQSEADAYASELLVPDPLPSAEVTVGSRHPADIETPLVNQSVRIVDNANGVDVTVPIEQQTITPGQATLTAGEGAAVNVERFNRNQKSKEDTTEPGSVYNTDRIADDAVESEKLVDTAVTEDKLSELSVAIDKVQPDAISETKVQDDAISTPKLEAGAVVAAKIQSDTITANEISAGTITALEIAADQITANEIDALNLDTNEIEIGLNTNTEIRFTTVDGDTAMVPDTDGAAQVGDDFDRFSNMFMVNLDTEALFAETGLLGESSDDRIELKEVSGATHLSPDTDDTCQLGDSSEAYEEMWAHDFINAVTGNSIIDGGDPLEGLAAEPRPPDHCRVCDDDGNEVGTSLNKLSKELWSICTAQQRRIEDLEERLSALEAQNE